MYTIYQESFDKVYTPEDWTDSFSNHISKPAKDDRTFTMQNTVGKLARECIVSGKLARDLEGREILPANQREGGGGGGQTRKMHMGKMQPHLHMTCTTFSRGKVKQWL